MQVAAVILAAGASTRFGSAKQVARLGGRTLLEAVGERAHEAGLTPVIAVVPPALPVRPDLVPVLNDAPEEGMSRSLRLGLAAVPVEADAAAILLGDQPTVPATTIRAVLEATRGDRPIVAARAGGRLAPPVLLMRDAFELAEEARGDEGLRALLATRPELVTPVDVPQHARDVDTVDDLEAIGERCPGCGALFESLPDGPTHEYIGASAACWAAFNEVLAREFGDPAYGRVHRHTVDVYAAQHPGEDGRRQRQSVALHLVALCLWLEHAVPTKRLNAATQALAGRGREWPWLDPPSAYGVTVLDALAARSGDEHATRVRQWAESVWDAWSAHHDVVRRWAAEALD